MQGGTPSDALMSYNAETTRERWYAGAGLDARGKLNKLRFKEEER